MNRRARLQPGQDLRRRLQQLQAQVRKEAHGRTYTPKRNPPIIVDVPWNQVIVSEYSTSGTSATTSTSFNSYSVYLLLTSQLGLQSFAPSLEFRFIRIEMWNMATSANSVASLVMDVYPLQTKASGEVGAIARVEDAPGRQQWAAVGYEWPSSHQNYVFQIAGAQPSTDPTIVRYFTDLPSSAVLLRFHLLWRPTVALPPMLNRFRSSLNSSVNSTRSSGEFVKV